MKGKPFRDRDNQALHDKRMNESVRVAISRKNIEFILAHQHDSREELARYLRQCKKSWGIFLRNLRLSAAIYWRFDLARG